MAASSVAHSLKPSGSRSAEPRLAAKAGKAAATPTTSPTKPGQGEAGRGRPSKGAQKSVDELSKDLGIDKVWAELELAIKLVDERPMATMSPPVADLAKAAVIFRKHVSAAQKLGSAIFTKVSKWTCVPEEWLSHIFVIARS